MVISHDRYLIERIADSTWALFGDGTLTNLPGGISQYLQRRREAGTAAVGRSGTAAASPSAAESDAEVAESGLSAAEQHGLRKQMNALERKMAKLEEKERGCHEEMAALSADVATMDTARLTEARPRGGAIAPAARGIGNAVARTR